MNRRTSRDRQTDRQTTKERYLATTTSAPSTDHQQGHLHLTAARLETNLVLKTYYHHVVYSTRTQLVTNVGQAKEQPYYCSYRYIDNFLSTFVY
ncbi:hypothetical protein Pcinc_015960 [Petrolisthes cinctipes]|uniref:Uncharacterized protein n=1 Tax=Petrolisthes cinctipes TaxID=88211 RepID=A0AAE1FTS4_PETCI|nr:hypothetical protein Pcinc_015960 [Petrolisthes cinctipes]